MGKDWYEIARTLKPGAAFYSRHYDSRPRLLNPNVKISIPISIGVYHVNNLQYPEMIVGYKEAFMRAMIAQAGLVLEQTHYGSWCGRETFVDVHDILIVQRPEH